MALTLRADKGTQLTYNELDSNFLSFFYSASVSSNQQFLNLHYTGSAGLSINATSVQIPLNPYTGSAVTPGGSNSQIQFNNSNAFGGVADLVFDTTKTAVGIGQVTIQGTDRLATRGGDIRIESTAASYNPRLVLNFDSASIDYSGSISMQTDDAIMEFRNFSTENSSNSDSGMAFHIDRFKTSPAFQIHGNGKIGFRNANTNYGDINLSGSLLIDGNAGNINRLFRIRSVDSSATTVPFTSTMGNAGNARGVVLDGPDKGHVIVGLQSLVASQGASQTFSILSGPPTSSNYNISYNSVVAMFKANGQVGIGTHTVAGSNKLHVAGAISGSSIETSGAIKAGGNLSGSNQLYIGSSSTLSGSVTLNTVGNAATATHYDYLVLSQSKIVKQVNAAPIPVGGIIMWSGAVQSLPAGFHLCNGATTGSTTTPDLRNRFVVGSNNVSGTPTSTVSASALASGGHAAHDHGGTTGGTSITTANMPSHTHPYKDSYYIEINNPGIGSAGAIDGVDYVGPTQYKGSGDSDNDNKYVYYRNGTTTATGGGTAHTHTIGEASNVPPYYALAYIMYVGSTP